MSAPRSSKWRGGRYTSLAACRAIWKSTRRSSTQGVEGTEGLVQVEADRTLITIFEGRVLAANAAGSLPIASGQSAVAVQGQAPVLRTVVRPRDAVQWALYYPPVAYFRPEDFQGTQPWQGMARNSVEAYMKGDYQTRLRRPQGRSGRHQPSRASSLTARHCCSASGESTRPAPDLERALKLNPNYSDALALQSLIAVVQNDKEKALGIAQKAVAANAKSATALTALSYAQQANFDLEGARKSLQQAVQAEPNNALAWARLAEIHLSFADLDDAPGGGAESCGAESRICRGHRWSSASPTWSRVNTVRIKESL